MASPNSPMKIERPEDNEGINLENVEDDDLFEIDLKVVNSIPPPYYWESYFTATGNALFANCMIPISDVSNAVPMIPNGTATSAGANVSTILMMIGLTPGELGVSCVNGYLSPIAFQRKRNMITPKTLTASYADNTSRLGFPL